MASKFTKLRSVTLGVLKLAKGEPRYIYIASPLYVGKKMKNDQKNPAILCKAVDLETGELGLIIAPAVMCSELTSAYPGDSYVGKCFELVVTRVPEQRYNMVQISEIAMPDDFVRPVGMSDPNGPLLTDAAYREMVGAPPPGDDDDDGESDADDHGGQGGDPDDKPPAPAPAAKAAAKRVRSK